MNLSLYFPPCIPVLLVWAVLFVLLWLWGRLWNREWLSISCLLFASVLPLPGLNAFFRAQAFEEATPHTARVLCLKTEWMKYRNGQKRSPRDAKLWQCHLMKAWGRTTFADGRAMHQHELLLRLLNECTGEEADILAKADDFRRNKRRKEVPEEWTEEELLRLSELANAITHRYMKEAYADEMRAAKRLALPLSGGGLLLALLVTACMAVRDIRCYEKGAE